MVVVDVNMDELLEQLKALGEPNRFRIVMMLRERPLCVCEMLEVLDISGATISNHLKTLRFCGLVGSRRDGKWIEYCLESGAEDLLDLLWRRTGDADPVAKDINKLKSLDRQSCTSD